MYIYVVLNFLITRFFTTFHVYCFFSHSHLLSRDRNSPWKEQKFLSL
jgi:hypothetical protein